MNFSWWRITMFALVGAAGLAFLAWYDPPSGANVVDRHTGLTVDGSSSPGFRRMYTASASIRAARSMGNALTALERLEKARYEVANPASLEPVLRLLSAEVRPLREEFIADDKTYAYDRDTAEATEEFFAPMVQRRPRARDIEAAVKRYEPPDKIAALVIASVGGHADSVPSDLAILVARSMQANERPRARLRWLIRAFNGEDPTDELCLSLSRAFLEHERLEAGFAALAGPVERGTKNRELLQLRMDVSRWAGKPQAEIEAIEALLEIEETVALLNRGIEACLILGSPELAVPYATRIAELSGNVEDLGHAADLAFKGGSVEEGFTLLRRAVDQAEDKRAWREKLTMLLLVDLRLNEAIEQYQILFANYPDGDYGKPLEELLRRRNRAPDLLEVLKVNYAKKPSEKLEVEMIRIAAVLGKLDGVRTLIQPNVDALDDPGQFFRNILLYNATRVEGLDRTALRLIESGELTPEDVEKATSAIWEMKEEPGFVRVALTIGTVHADVPEAREVRLACVDWGRSPEQAASFAEKLYRADPKSTDMLAAWIQRANWSGRMEFEIEARRAWLGHFPKDAENLRLLADLLDFAKRYGEAADTWRVLVAIEGEGTESERRFLDSLRAADRFDEELEYLKIRAGREGLTLEERLFIAERFFAGQWMDVALALYVAILTEAPGEPTALLRVGLIRLWGNDPDGATPYLERLFEIEGPGNGELPFYLGEACLATERRAEAWEMMEIALPLLRTVGDLTIPREEMVAKILARTGHVEEAIAIYERLVSQVPDDQNLVLDYAVAMVATRRVEDARRVVDMALALDPESRRVLRMHGQVLMMEKKYDEAIDAFRKGIDKYGPDAGYFADLGQACLEAERLSEAEEAFGHVLELQPDSEYAGWTKRVLGDRLRTTVEVGGRARLVGEEDDSLEAFLAGTFQLGDERTRGAFALGHGSFTGRSAAVDDGKTDVTADINSLGLAVLHRVDRNWEFGGGLDFYSGRDGAPPLGGWIGATWRQRKPYAAVAGRIHVNQPFTDPAAAAGLAGNSSGIMLEGSYQAPSDRWWVSGTAGYRSLSIDVPGSGGITNGQATLGLVGGYWIHNRGPRVADRLMPRRIPFSREGTTVASEPPDGEGLRLSTWLAYTGIRLLSDKTLATALPMGEAFDYVTIAARAEGRVLAGIYYEVEGYAGTDLRDPKIFGGLAAGVAIRPSPGFELRLRAGHGLAFGREGGDTGSTEIRLALTLLW